MGDAAPASSGGARSAPAPKLSVVVPTRDRHAMLRHALASVTAQTHRPLEVVVVDDGSDEPVVLDEAALAEAGVAVQLVRMDEPLGPGGARNRGVAAATGDLVLFLDDDDSLPAERVATAVAGIGDRPMHAMACAANSRRFEGDLRSSLMRGGLPLAGQVVVRRAVVAPFDETLRVSEDIDWWLSMRPHAVFAWSDDVGVVLGSHDGPRVGVDPTVRLACRVRVAERHRARVGRHDRALLESRVASAALMAGQRRTVLRYALRSLADRPTALACKLFIRALLGRMGD